MIMGRMRHVTLVALAVILGVLLCGREGSLWLPISLAIVAVIIFGLTAGSSGSDSRQRLVMSVILLGTCVAAFLVCQVRERGYECVQEILEENSPTEISGKIYRKEIRTDDYVYYLRTSYKKILVYYDSDDIPVGARVTVRGDMQLFSHATNEGEFDFADDYRYQGISCRFFADDMEDVAEPAFSIRESLYRLKKGISATFFAAMNERDAGVMSTLTVGSKGLIDSEVKAMYQQAGISHILAISGLHISILGMGIYRFLRKIKCPCRISEAAGCGVIFLFVLMSGFGTSSVRALAMYFVMMGANTFGRRYDSLNALSIAAIILLFANPMSIYRSGFQFSFTAIAAIVMYNALRQAAQKRKEDKEKERASGNSSVGDGEGVVRLIKNKIGNESGEKKKKKKSVWGKILGNIGQRCVMGAFLQLFLMPLTAWIYFEVPIYSMFLNLIILPLCSALLGFGLAGGIAGMIFPQFAKWLLLPCHVILRIYEFSVNVVNRLPLAQWITGKPAGWMMFVYYAVLVAVCFMFLRIYRTGAFVILCRCIPLLLLICILFAPHKKYPRIDFLDVGQGDCEYVSDGAGTDIMIDGGSSSVSGVGNYRIEPFLKYNQIRKVDVWILTHSDSDHYSGLLELLTDGYDIDYLLLASVIPRDETWETIVAAAGENKTQVVYVASGDGISIDGGSMTCLYPSLEDASDDSNDLSQVWEYEKDGLSVLFTGDIGEEQEELLIERGLAPDVDVLKCAHHGSKYSSCGDFLAATSPEYTVISVGANNLYGHPAEETLDRLAAVCSTVYQTQYDGQVSIVEWGGEWRLRTFISE